MQKDGNYLRKWNDSVVNEPNFVTGGSSKPARTNVEQNNTDNPIKIGSKDPKEKRASALIKSASEGCSSSRTRRTRKGK